MYNKRKKFFPRGRGKYCLLFTEEYCLEILSTRFNQKVNFDSVLLLVTDVLRVCRAAESEGNNSRSQLFRCFFGG